MSRFGLGLPPPRSKHVQPEWKSPEGHTLFRPPPSHEACVASTSSYLDPSIIPSFPPNFAGVGSGRLSLAQTLSYHREAPAGDPRAAKGHARTWSGTPATALRQVVPPANYLILDANRLGLNPKRVQSMIRVLRSLVPKDRMPSGGIVSPECLPGNLLLVPGGMLLEAVLLERDGTTGASASKEKTLPPALGSGASLFPSFDDGIDWRAMATYVETFGKLLDAFLPILARPLSAMQVAASVEAAVLSGLKKQVSKLKKLLSDVVAHYVDRFAWLNGMWDESALVKTVEEVASWSKLVEM